MTQLRAGLKLKKMIILLKEDWVSGQNIQLKAGDKIDVNRDTYLKLLKEDKCEAIDKKDLKLFKKKTKKNKIDGDLN
jgi:hypothetical protein